MTDPDPDRVVIELRTVADPHVPARPFGVRLKMALKQLLRQHGLKCERLCDGSKVEVVTRTASISANNEGRN